MKESKTFYGVLLLTGAIGVPAKGLKGDNIMIDPKDYWFKMSWTQSYDTWPKPVARTAEYQEPQITDFAQAREVLSRIMAK